MKLSIVSLCAKLSGPHLTNLST